MNTLIFILICYGASNNMIYGSIFEGWRVFLTKFGTGGYSLYKLFTCFMCLSTWIGFLLSFIMIMMGVGDKTPAGSYGITSIILLTFLNGMVATAGVWLIHQIVEALERSNSSN